jgi:uncharacterized protein (TIGR02757 family)
VADNARKLIVRLYDHFGDDIFEVTDDSVIREVFHSVSSDTPLSRLKERIPEILASVNKFVTEKAGDDIIGYSREFRNPLKFVNILGSSIIRMGRDKNSARKKAWMYMRWMVREYPDLRIFDHFSPRDLFVPLDKNVARVAVSLGVLKSLNNPGWSEVVKVTEFARTLYPEDPAKVDDSFFLLGRQIKELKLPLSTESLKLLLNKLVPS